MQRVGRFLMRRREDRCLMIHAWCLSALVRAGLWLLPLKTLQHVLTWRLSTFQTNPVAGPIDSIRITAAVQTAAGYIPNATCLVQALVAARLLKRSGYPVTLQIGVNKDANKQLRAHAWLETHGTIVLGRFDDNSYTSILVWK